MVAGVSALCSQPLSLLPWREELSDDVSPGLRRTVSVVLYERTKTVSLLVPEPMGSQGQDLWPCTYQWC